MNYLWSPWRMIYLEQHEKIDGCVFCRAQSEPDDAANLIAYRGQRAYVILNLYPYTSGHLMVVPFDHKPDLEKLDAGTRAEMMELATRCMTVLRDLYHPEGFNMGANIGEAAGADVGVPRGAAGVGLPGDDEAPLRIHRHDGVALGIRGVRVDLELSFDRRRLAPGPTRRDLAWGAGFLALAVFLVLAVAMTTGLVMKPEQSPQRDLQELLRSLSGWGPTLAMFLVVAGLAPFFEELLFRGFLFPVLARKGHVGLALLASALLFGAIHLQPAGLPILSTLGLVLALAVRQTGSLWPAILVHACWNGSLFLLMRAFA